MTRTLFSLVLLSACAPGTIKLADDTAGSVEEDTSSDADSGTDTDTGSDTDTAADTDEQPELVPDYSVWNATRRFYYDYSEYGYECDETVVETGGAVSEGSSDFAALHEMCGICDYFYEVTPDRDSACDWIPLGTTWRGVVHSDGAAAVYFYRESDGELEEYATDDSASFDGTTIGYDYEFDYYTGYFTIQVSGEAVYPLVEAE